MKRLTIQQRASRAKSIELSVSSALFIMLLWECYLNIGMGYDPVYQAALAGVWMILMMMATLGDRLSRWIWINVLVAKAVGTPSLILWLYQSGPDEWKRVIVGSTFSMVYVIGAVLLIALDNPATKPDVR